MAAKGTFGYFFALEQKAKDIIETVFLHWNTLPLRNGSDKVLRRSGAKAWMSPTAPFLSRAKEMGERTPWEPHTGFHIRTCRPQEHL